MISFPVVAYTGIVLLGFARGRALRALGRLLTLGVAAGFTALALSLLQLGEDRNWTGDGPGMLVVMLLIPIAGLLAVATWGAVLAQWRLRRSAGIDARLALGAVFVGLAGSAWEARDSVRLARPSHDASIAAVAFAATGDRLYSIDEAGTLKSWDAKGRRFASERRDPSLASTRALLVDGAGDVAVALGPYGARVLPLANPTAAVSTLPGVVQAVLLPGRRLAWTRAGALRIDFLPAPDPESAPIALDAPVTALAADREGVIAAALADGRLVLAGADGVREVVKLPGPALRLAVSPGGAWALAADAERRAHRVDLRTGAVEPLSAWLGLHHVAFVADDVLVFTSSAESPEAFAMTLGDGAPTTGPWMNHGQTVTALGAAPGAPEAAVALGPQLFFARAPRRGGDPADATRLSHPR